MTEQAQNLQWKSYQGREHCYWSDFKRINEFPMLVTQFIGTGNGYNPASYGPFEHNGYKYYAVEKPTRADPKKTYFDIERVPLTAASSQAPPSTNYSNEGAAKGHAENLQMHEESKAMHKELMAQLKHLCELVAEDIKLRKADGITLDLIRQHTEIIAQGETKRSSFKAASVTIKTDPQAELKEEFGDEEEIVQ